MGDTFGYEPDAGAFFDGFAQYASLPSTVNLLVKKLS